MSLVNMLTWWQWAILAAVPPAIVLLYFLKLKRSPLEVPSTYLWRKSIEDLHVNSIWQRLRTSLLLFLQLLLVLLVIAALVRPGWSGSRLVGNRYVFLIDNSASMQSRDVRPTRLAEAQRRARELIEQMDSGDAAMIVSFADSARVEQVFTDNRQELIRQLAAIRPTNRTTSLEEALRVAAGLANSGGTSPGSDDEAAKAAPQGVPATLYIFSDGRFPDVKDFRLGNLTPVFVPIGEPQPANLAITSFTTSRRPGDEKHVQAFARLQNFGPAAAKSEVELYRDGELADTSAVEIAPGESESLVFDLGELASGELRLKVSSGGVLAVDDEAWTAIAPPRRGRVLLVTSGNDALKLAVSTESAKQLADVEIARPGILKSPEYRQRAAAGYYALVIYDDCSPDELPQANTLFIGRLPPEGWKQGDAKTAQAPQIIDVESSHPLMQLIDLGNVRFAEATILSPPSGGTALVSVAEGPLLAIAPRGTFEDAVLGGPIVAGEAEERYANTDWPLRVSFPVFVMNVLDYLGGARSGNSPASIRPGAAIALDGVGSSGEISVREPDGQVHQLTRSAGSAAQFSETDQLGVYQITEAGQPARSFAVNLFDAAESRVDPRQAIDIGYEKVTGEASWEGGRTELWKLLLLAVLCVLCVEWYIYNRRVHV